MASKNGHLSLFDGLGRSAVYTSNVAAQSGFPFSRLQTVDLANRTRWAAGLSGITLDVDFGSTVQADTLALLGNNFTLGATWRVQASTLSNLTSPAIDTVSAVPIFDQSLPRLAGPSSQKWRPRWGWPAIYLHSSVVSFRYVRFTMSDSTNTDGHLAASIFRAGAGYQMERNFARGWTSDMLRGNLRGHRLTFHRIEEDEKNEVLSLAAALETYGRMLAIPQPLNKPSWLMEAIWCKLEGMPQILNINNKLWSVELTLREVDD